MLIDFWRVIKCGRGCWYRESFYFFGFGLRKGYKYRMVFYYKFRYFFGLRKGLGGNSYWEVEVKSGEGRVSFVVSLVAVCRFYEESTWG